VQLLERRGPEGRRQGRTAKLEDVKRQHWNAIVVRHAWMIEEYEPEVCGKTLATYVEALRYAAIHDLELANFGY
jgi:hypothetical protein